MQSWGRERAADVARIVDRALPDECLAEDDLAVCLWDETDPAIVVGLPGGEGVVAAVVRDVGQHRIAAVQLIAVLPEVRRRGHGRALLEHVRTWAFDEHNVLALHAAGGTPFYLWPGVDVRATEALCFFERSGFERLGAALNMSYPSSFRAPLPAGLVVLRVEHEREAKACLAFVARHWPQWVEETQRAVDRRSCLLVMDDNAAITGFGCHSVNRKGWLGPMGTDPDKRHAGLGKSLLGAIAADVHTAGMDSVEVSWLGPVGFYANGAGATMSRAFQTMTLHRPA